MKKFLAAIFVLSAIAFNANATGFYVGADALLVDSQSKIANLSISPNSTNTKSNPNKIGYGINAGVRADLLLFFASAEAFYDNLGTSYRHFQTAQSGSGVRLSDRYGVKANVGAKIFPYFKAFVTYGLANVNYSSASSAGNISKTDFAPLYGVGLLFDVPATSLSVKAAYDYQQFNVQYSGGGKSRDYLGVARLGVIYNF